MRWKFRKTNINTTINTRFSKQKYHKSLKALLDSALSATNLIVSDYANLSKLTKRTDLSQFKLGLAPPVNIIYLRKQCFLIV